MKTKLFTLSVLLCGMGFLSGCASLNSNFDCPMKPGVMCQSLDQVNTQVDQGTLGGDLNTRTCKNCRPIKDNSMNDVSHRNNLAVSYLSPADANNTVINTAINSDDPIRANETVLRIWMAPFEDKDGHYYQPTVLYTVVKPGFWLGEPVKAITNEGDNT